MQYVSWPKGESLIAPPSPPFPLIFCLGNLSRLVEGLSSEGTFHTAFLKGFFLFFFLSTVPYGLTPFVPSASLKCQTCRHYCFDRSLASHSIIIHFCFVVLKKYLSDELEELQLDTSNTQKSTFFLTASYYLSMFFFALF